MKQSSFYVLVKSGATTIQAYTFVDLFIMFNDYTSLLTREQLK